MSSIVNNIRHLLFGWANREFLTFLFFLALAGIFWLLTTLNESFEQEVRIPVRFVNVPANVVLTSGEKDTLRFTVQDKGISLITYIYNNRRQPIDIDFRRYSNGDGTGAVPSSDLLRMAETRLPASAKATGVKPETKVFYYNNGEKKTVPVVFAGKVEADAPYYIADTIINPSEVTVYATESKLDSIQYVTIVPVRKKGFRDSLFVSAKLQPIVGAKIVPEAVTVNMHTDMLTEVTIDNIPVIGINMPEGKVLRTFPAKLSVSFTVGMREYQSVTPEDFLVVADYLEFSADTSAQCNVYLRRQPDGIQRPKLDKTRVDYLIEDHE